MLWMLEELSQQACLQALSQRLSVGMTTSQLDGRASLMAPSQRSLR